MSDPRIQDTLHDTLHDVLIAGAGPVGLFLACELRLAGASVLVLEREGDPRSPLKRLPFGLRGLSVATREALDRRGLLGPLDEARRADGPVDGVAHWAGQPRRPGGHFAGIPFHLDAVDAARWPYRLPGPAGAGMWPVALETLEAVLAARAAALGAKIRRGVGVEAVEASDAGVAVRAGGATVRGRWLVGCDGGRSRVRTACGFAFAGTEPEFTGYSLAVDLADPDSLAPGRHATPAGMYTYARPGTVTLVDFDGGARHRAGPVTPAQAQAVLARVSGVDVALTGLRQAATWTDRAYQATAYRRGRVLLAGDAAHVHAPLGGQGLNLGLGDALNLGWKLGATVRGDAPDGLLDTYGRERRPAGARVLDWSRAQVALLRPDAGTRALAALVRDLVATRDGATYCAERVWGVGLRQDLGDHRGDDRPVVGRDVPDFARLDGTRVGDLMRTGGGLFLEFASSPSLGALAGRWAGRVAYAPGPVREDLGLRAVLVRPDGVVAWASEDAPDAAEAARALALWFGAPAGAP